MLFKIILRLQYVCSYQQREISPNALWLKNACIFWNTMQIHCLKKLWLGLENAYIYWRRATKIHCLKNMITNEKCYGDSLFEEHDYKWEMLWRFIVWRTWLQMTNAMEIHCLKNMTKIEKCLASFEVVWTFIVLRRRWLWVTKHLYLLKIMEIHGLKVIRMVQNTFYLLKMVFGGSLFEENVIRIWSFALLNCTMNEDSFV
jgi:hypothetical protein